jgi:hypothetical protein
MDDKLTDSIVTSATLKLGRRTASNPLKGSLADVRIYNRVLSPGEVTGLFDAPNIALAAMGPEKRTELQEKELKKYFREYHFPALAAASTAAADALKAEQDLENSIPSTMVMAEAATPHDTFVLVRGQYDQHGEKVTAGLPASLPALPPGAPSHRLGLAEWLVSPVQPLTARVIVNRYWQMYFGTGIVKTAEDFGSQGEWPSHPELLDWMATEFRQSGWDIRKLQKQIVMSATYRQSSFVSPELAARDPENRLLAHGLAISGRRDRHLFAESGGKIGGAAEAEHAVVAGIGNVDGGGGGAGVDDDAFGRLEFAAFDEVGIGAVERGGSLAENARRGGVQLDLSHRTGNAEESEEDRETEWSHEEGRGKGRMGPY